MKQFKQFKKLNKLCFKIKNQLSNLEFLFDEHQNKIKQPSFNIYSGQLEILKDPIDFYVMLHTQINTLYIGNGNLEKYLIAQINNKIKRSKKINVTLLMDYFRGTRINSKKESSLSVVKELKTTNIHNKNVKIGMFANPIRNKFFSLETESPLREIFGVHHMKFYIFDDNVILTGANLSEDYFTDRQDRYFFIKNAPQLANYLGDLAGVIAGNSYQVEENGELNTINMQPFFYQIKNFKQVFGQHFKMFLFQNRISKQKTQEFQTYIQDDDDYCSKFNIQQQQSRETKDNNKQNEQKEQIYDVSDLLQKFHENTELQNNLEDKKQKAKIILENSFDAGDVGNIIRRIQDSLYKEDDKQGELINLGGKVYIFPTIQLPCIDYREDQILMQKFLEFNCAKESSQVKFVSGYLNPTHQITKILQQSIAQVQVLTASPKCNGFYKAGRVKKWIPNLYRANALQLINNIKNITLYEYLRGAWTFHSKGLWIIDKEDSQPTCTIIGSSNFGQRSYDRDTECQFFFYSQCPEFKQKLQSEIEYQFHHSEQINDEQIKNDQDTRVSVMIQMLKKLLNSFL